MSTSEFGGMDGPHGMDPRKPSHLLTASEKLRLMYSTGTANPAAPIDEARHAWNGTEPTRYEQPAIKKAKEALEEA